jgi:predicted ATPase
MLGEKPLRLGARALDLLHLLVIHAGEVVGKDQLISFVWPNTFVHESNLKVNIAALRRVLPRTASGLSCIATVSGRGYRFVAPLRVYGGDGQLSPEPTKMPVWELPSVAEVIGREEAIADLAAKLRECRLMTVVGPAGVGKTTLAVTLARHLPDRFGDGVCFVDLAAIGDPQLVDATIAASLGVSGKWTNMLAGIVETLRDREMLLLLDNCEHVLSTASAIAEHLTLALPNIHAIATSREPLRARSESVYRLSPLPYPDEKGGENRTEAMAFPAVQLFVKRAQAAYGFRVEDADFPAISAICRRLDGIALAIELAASRLPVLKPAALLNLMKDSFAPLIAGSGETPQRHQTLLATLDWSYQLLSRDEAWLLRLLSVFSASFSLSDVIGVAGRIDRSFEEIAVGLESLAAKSLLSTTHDAGGRRYRLLDSTRSFAGERLEMAGEAADAQSSHAHYILRLFERAEAEWHWRPRKEWTASYEPRTNDLRKAIDWALGNGLEDEVGVRLTCAAIPLWDELSTVSESRRRVERALQCVEALSRCDPAVKMKLIASFASGLNFSDHLGPEADAAWIEANELARRIENVDYQFRTLWGLGILQCFTGRHRQAMVTLTQFAKLAAGHKDDRQVAAEGERVRLMAAFYCGDVRHANDDLKRLARDYAASAKRSGVARFQMDRFVSIRVALAMTAWVAGDRGEAVAALRDALEHSVAHDHLVSHSNAIAQAALPIALWSGECEIVRQHVATLARNLALREIAIWRPVCRFYEGAVACMDGEAEGVGTMHQAIEQLIANNFVVRVPFYLSILAEAALHRGQIALARDSLSAAFDRADRQGEHWSRPELLRVRGLLQRLDGDLAGASETLLLAAETARESGALFFRLRASTSLAELWAETDRPEAAAQLLSPVCAEFDDVLSCATVAKARRLLEVLARQDVVARSGLS